MDFDPTTIVSIAVVIVGLFVVVWFFKVINRMAKRDAAKMTKKEIIQQRINQKATQSNVRSNSIGKVWAVFWILVLIGLFVLGVFAFREGIIDFDEIFHP